MDHSLAIMIGQLCYGKISFIVLIPGGQRRQVFVQRQRAQISPASPWPRHQKYSPQSLNFDDQQMNTLAQDGIVK